MWLDLRETAPSESSHLVRTVHFPAEYLHAYRVPSRARLSLSYTAISVRSSVAQVAKQRNRAHVTSRWQVPRCNDGFNGHLGAPSTGKNQNSRNANLFPHDLDSFQ
jgi:hypothetical protein